MAKQPGAPAPVVANSPKGISEIGSVNAPFIYFEEAPTFGHTNGVLQITLAAARMYPGPTAEQIGSDLVMVAHLRMNIAAAMALKAALDGALLLAAPAKTETKN